MLAKTQELWVVQGKKKKKESITHSNSCSWNVIILLWFPQTQPHRMIQEVLTKVS